jgi:hypothetical protein
MFHGLMNNPVFGLEVHLLQIQNKLLLQDTYCCKDKTRCIYHTVQRIILTCILLNTHSTDECFKHKFYILMAFRRRCITFCCVRRTVLRNKNIFDVSSVKISVILHLCESKLNSAYDFWCRPPQYKIPSKFIP